MSRIENPPCVLYPTPCHRFYTEDGGSLPCPLFDKGECRPFIRINEIKQDETLSYKDANTQITEARHDLCPVSMTIRPEDLISEAEKEVFDDFSKKLRLTKTNLA